MSSTNSDLGTCDGLKVVREEFDGGILTRYVEKPVEEIKVVEVPKITYVDVVKQVPDIRIETVEKEVEELFIDEVIKEVPKVVEKEVVKHVPVRKVVEVPVEHIRHVQVDEIVTREEIREVPGEIIEHEKHYEVQQPIIVPRYNDTTQPTVYQQLIKPEIRIGGPHDPKVDVEVYDFDPVLCKVLVHIPKPVKQPVWNMGVKGHKHQWMKNVKDYDLLVQQCNPHLTRDQLTGLLCGDSLIQPIPDTTIQGYTILGPAPMPGEFKHCFQMPAQLPRGPAPDPKPVMNATYVNAIAREAAEKTEKRNPQYSYSINALKTLRKHKYADSDYERYLVQHHHHFNDTADVVLDKRTTTAPPTSPSSPSPLPLKRSAAATESAKLSTERSGSNSHRIRSASEARYSPNRSRRELATASLDRRAMDNMESPRHKIHSSPRKIRTIRAE